MKDALLTIAIGACLAFVATLCSGQSVDDATLAAAVAVLLGVVTASKLDDAGLLERNDAALKS